MVVRKSGANDAVGRGFGVHGLAVLAALLTAGATPCSIAAARLTGPLTVISGATVIDLSHDGRSGHDIVGATVMVRGSSIVSITHGSPPRDMPHARYIEAAGRYIIPGLIDSYGAVRNDRFADAYLYEGVTTVVVPVTTTRSTVDGESQMPVSAKHLSILAAVALDTDKPRQETRADRETLQAGSFKQQIQAASRAGARAVVLGPEVEPSAFAIAVAEAHRKGLAVEAQPAATDYQTATGSDPDLFVRNDKYSMALSSPDNFEAYAADPNGAGGSAARREVCTAAFPETRASTFVQSLKQHGTFVMPVLAMESTADDLDGSNPWAEPTSRFIRASELDDPVDPATGSRPYLVEHPAAKDRIQACARRKREIDGRLHALGAVYVAGSSAPGYGVMPGSGLHDETRLLESIGLTPREALAAATSNAARALKLADRGDLAAGKRADIVLLRDDPRRSTSALETIDMVIAGGVIIDRNRLLKSAQAQLLAETAKPKEG